MKCSIGRKKDLITVYGLRMLDMGFALADVRAEATRLSRLTVAQIEAELALQKAEWSKSREAKKQNERMFLKGV